MMTPIEKARVLRNIASEYKQADGLTPADEVLELLTEDELYDLQMALSDGADQVVRHMEKRNLF
jgi:hypothetical protein